MVGEYLLMNCFVCGCPGSKILSQSVPQDKINQFGRREISFTVEHQDIVTYGKDGLYHCISCGGSFTFKEYTLQQKEKANPQTQLALNNRQEMKP
jgi:hypothetical protein